MKIYKFTSVLIILIFLCICCCLSENKELVIREYSHNASDNVTINIFINSWLNPQETLKVNNTSLSDIKITESFYLEKSGVINNISYIQDYVKFNDSPTGLIINISLAVLVDPSEHQISDLHAYIDLPINTTYTIYYVTSHEQAEWD